MTRASNAKPLTEWIVEVLKGCPNGMTKKQLLRALWTRGFLFNEASVPPTLTYLKDLGLLTWCDSVWKAVDDKVEILYVDDQYKSVG